MLRGNESFQVEFESPPSATFAREADGRLEARWGSWRRMAAFTRVQRCCCPCCPAVSADAVVAPLDGKEQCRPSLHRTMPPSFTAEERFLSAPCHCLLPHLTFCSSPTRPTAQPCRSGARGRCPSATSAASADAATNPVFPSALIMATDPPSMWRRQLVMRPPPWSAPSLSVPPPSLRSPSPPPPTPLHPPAPPPPAPTTAPQRYHPAAGEYAAAPAAAEVDPRPPLVPSMSPDALSRWGGGAPALMRPSPHRSPIARPPPHHHASAHHALVPPPVTSSALKAEAGHTPIHPPPRARVRGESAVGVPTLTVAPRADPPATAHQPEQYDVQGDRIAAAAPYADDRVQHFSPLCISEDAASRWAGVPASSARAPPPRSFVTRPPASTYFSPSAQRSGVSSSSSPASRPPHTSWSAAPSDQLDPEWSDRSLRDVSNLLSSSPPAPFSAVIDSPSGPLELRGLMSMSFNSVKPSHASPPPRRQTHPRTAHREKPDREDGRSRSRSRGSSRPQTYLSSSSSPIKSAPLTMKESKRMLSAKQTRMQRFFPATPNPHPSAAEDDHSDHQRHRYDEADDEVDFEAPDRVERREMIGEEDEQREGEVKKATKRRKRRKGFIDDSDEEAPLPFKARKRRGRGEEDEEQCDDDAFVAVDASASSQLGLYSSQAGYNAAVLKTLGAEYADIRYRHQHTAHSSTPHALAHHHTTPHHCTHSCADSSLSPLSVYCRSGVAGCSVRLLAVVQPRSCGVPLSAAVQRRHLLPRGQRQSEEAIPQVRTAGGAEEGPSGSQGHRLVRDQRTGSAEGHRRPLSLSPPTHRRPLLSSDLPLPPSPLAGKERGAHPPRDASDGGAGNAGDAGHGHAGEGVVRGEGAAVLSHALLPLGRHPSTRLRGRRAAGCVAADAQRWGEGSSEVSAAITAGAALPARVRLPHRCQ